MAIRPLDTHTVKRLTTSQVISSVFSAVKELVENSLDAGATNLQIVLKNKGASVIEVKDNGNGISSASATFMGLQGYTSKLSSFTDLESLTTYGFRGEALSSLCSVSKVQITTRTVQDDVGRNYTLDEKGVVTEVQHCHRTLGTSVRAENLFCNFPVRKKTITDPKTANKDIKTINKWLHSYGLCRPEVSISFTVDSKNIFLKHAKPNYRECLIEIFGRKMVSSCEFISHQDEKINIVLTVPRKDLSDLHEVCSAENCHIFVNKRPVYYEEFEKAIGKIIKEYFKDKIGKSKPCFFLRIDVSPAEIDVNLEPNKVKVLMINQSGMLNLIKKKLAEYYGLQEDEEEAEVNNTEIFSSPAYFDSTFNDSETEEEMSNKKRKLTKKNSRSSLKKSKMSDNDKENTLQTENVIMVDGFVNEKDKSDLNEGSKVNENEKIGDVDMELEETLSQVYEVNIGEDFCTQEILDKPTLSTEALELLEKKMQSNEILSSENVSVTPSTPKTPQYTLSQWSRGHLPIQGGTNVIIGKPHLGTPRNKPQFKTDTESGFQIFCRTHQSKISNENPGINPVEVATKMAEKWRLLTPAQRQHYRDLGRNTQFPFDASFSYRSQKKKPEKAPEKDNRLLKMLKQKLDDRKLVKVKDNEKITQNENKNEEEKEKEIENDTSEKRVPTKVPFDINIDRVREANENKYEVNLEKYRIIGKINELCFASTNTQIWRFELNDLFDELKLEEEERQICEGEKKKIEKYFNQWIEENEDLSILHRVYDLKNFD